MTGELLGACHPALQSQGLHFHNLLGDEGPPRAWACAAPGCPPRGGTAGSHGTRVARCTSRSGLDPAASPAHARSVGSCSREPAAGRGVRPRPAARTRAASRPSVSVCGTVRFVLPTDVYGSWPLGQDSAFRDKRFQTPDCFHAPFIYFFSWQVKIPHHTETQRPVVSGHPQVKPSLCLILCRGQLDTSQTEPPPPPPTPRQSP